MEEKWQETDLYDPVRQFWLQSGYQVLGEVAHCDVLACRQDFWVAIELKKRLNLDVILQAVNRQRLADEVWIAIPAGRHKLRSAHWKHLLHLLRRLELGLLLVDLDARPPSVNIILQSRPFDREKSRRLYRQRQKQMRSEFNSRHGDQNAGGSTGRKLMTHYREQSLLAAALLERNGPSSPARLRQLGSDSQVQRKLYQNHYGWFHRLERGVYDLAGPGRKAVSEHRDLVGKLLAELETRDSDPAD